MYAEATGRDQWFIHSIAAAVYGKEALSPHTITPAKDAVAGFKPDKPAVN